MNESEQKNALIHSFIHLFETSTFYYSILTFVRCVFLSFVVFFPSRLKPSKKNWHVKINGWYEYDHVAFVQFCMLIITTFGTVARRIGLMRQQIQSIQAHVNIVCHGIWYLIGASQHFWHNLKEVWKCDLETIEK